MQLWGLVVELREGLQAALGELCELRQKDHGLEEKLQAHQTDVDDKIMGLKNTLNTFKVLEKLDSKNTHLHSLVLVWPLKHNLEHLTWTLLNCKLI